MLVIKFFIGLWIILLLVMKIAMLEQSMLEVGIELGYMHWGIFQKVKKFFSIIKLILTFLGSINIKDYILLNEKINYIYYKSKINGFKATTIIKYNFFF